MAQLVAPVISIHVVNLTGTDPFGLPYEFGCK